MIMPAKTTDEKMALVAYLASKMGADPAELVGHMPYEIVATLGRDSKPNGAVMYIDYRRTTIEMACAGERGWLTRSHLHDLFAYPFEQLRVWTVLTVVRRRNAKARAFNVKLGFTELGIVRNSPHKAEDSILYTMSRPECRWLPAFDLNKLNGRAAHGAVAA